MNVVTMILNGILMIYTINLSINLLFVLKDNPFDLCYLQHFQIVHPKYKNHKICQQLLKYFKPNSDERLINPIRINFVKMLMIVGKEHDLDSFAFLKFYNLLSNFLKLMILTKLFFISKSKNFHFLASIYLDQSI